MIEVKFYGRDEVKDENLKFAVVIARYRDKWVFCKHKERTTYECPGGHREAGESIILTAERELYEETGALEYCLESIGIYSVIEKDEINKDSGSSIDNKESYGMLFFAEIRQFGQLPQMEIEKIELFEELPNNWTYPLIQLYLFNKLQQIKSIKY